MWTFIRQNLTSPDNQVLLSCLMIIPVMLLLN